MKQFWINHYTQKIIEAQRKLRKTIEIGKIFYGTPIDYNIASYKRKIRIYTRLLIRTMNE